MNHWFQWLRQPINLLVMSEVDKNVEAVREKLKHRSADGIKKYGVTTDRDDIGLDAWITHLQEELMDATIYIEASKAKMKRMDAENAALYERLALMEKLMGNR